MEENVLLAELTKNCEGKKEKLFDLLKAYELACIGYDLQEQRCKDVHNRVLRENEFFCVRDFSRDTGFNVGDRITDDEYLFLLSDEDFDKVMKLARPILVEEKITDENGYFLEDWGGMRGDSWRELVYFIVDEIIPISLRHNFETCKRSIVQGNKLIDAFKKSIAA